MTRQTSAKSISSNCSTDNSFSSRLSQATTILGSKTSSEINRDIDVILSKNKPQNNNIEKQSVVEQMKRKDLQMLEYLNSTSTKSTRNKLCLKENTKTRTQIIDKAC